MRGHIQQLKEQVTELKGTVKELKGEVVNLREQLSDMTDEDKTIKATEQLQGQLLLTGSSFLQLESSAKAKVGALGQFEASLVYAVKAEASEGAGASSIAPAESEGDSVVAKMETLLTNTAVTTAVSLAIQDVAGLEGGIEIDALPPMGPKQIEHSVRVVEVHLSAAHDASSARAGAGAQQNANGISKEQERDQGVNVSKTPSGSLEGQPDESADVGAFAKDAGRKVVSAAITVVTGMIATAMLI